VQRLYAGVQLFKRGRQLVLAAPPDRAELVQDKVCGLSVDELFSVNWLHGVFGQDAERILGPAHVYYADSTTFRPESALAGRPISSGDAGAYRSLAAALDSNELEDSGFSGDAFPAFGAFSGDVLCAAASYSVWEPSIAHIIVATHPRYRRRGFASAAIRTLAAHAFDRGLILQWRTVAWNENSLALARSLGFSHYCSTLYVRLRSSRE
jgi:GNAT superfamily N-acetyltransferase